MITTKTLSPVRALKRRSKGYISVEILLGMLAIGVITAGSVFGARALLARADARAVDADIQTVYEGLSDLTLHYGGRFGLDSANLEADMISRSAVPDEWISADQRNFRLRGFDVSIVAAGNSVVNSSFRSGHELNAQVPVGSSGGISSGGGSAYLFVHGINDTTVCSQLVVARPFGEASNIAVAGGFVATNDTHPVGSNVFSAIAGLSATPEDFSTNVLPFCGNADTSPVTLNITINATSL